MSLYYYIKVKKMIKWQETHDPRCGPGEVYVHGFTDAYGRYVRPHCRKNKPTRVRKKKGDKK